MVFGFCLRLQVYQQLREELAKVKTLEGIVDVNRELKLRCQVPWWALLPQTALSARGGEAPHVSVWLISVRHLPRTFSLPTVRNPNSFASVKADLRVRNLLHFCIPRGVLLFDFLFCFFVSN